MRRLRGLALALVLALPAPVAGDLGLGGIPALVGRGEDRAALRSLEGLGAERRESPAARYLQARLLERLGRPSEAADRLDGLSEGVPAEVADEARHRRARLLARAGRCAEARPLLEELGRPRGEAGAVARALRAECLLALGEAAEAVTAFQAVVAEDAGAVDQLAARMGLAEALAATGRTDEAVAALVAALVARPAHPDVAEVRARLAALGAPEPRFTYAERLERAERLSRALRHEEALAELDAAGLPATTPERGDRARAGQPSERARWLHLRGMALYAARRYPEAAHVLRQAYVASRRLAVEDAFHAARALARADRDAQAVVAFAALVRAHPESARAAEAEFLAAWLELQHGRASGEARMRRFLDGPRGNASAERRRAALWELALRAFERGRHASAAALFQRYAESGAGAMIQARGLYWRGRAEAEGGALGDAAASYRRALEVEPLHWYALLAAERLRSLGEDPGPPFGAPAPAPAGAVVRPAPPALPPIVTFHADLGLRDDAVEALRAREAEVRGTLPGEAGLQALMAGYRRLREATRPYRLVAGRAPGLAAPSEANRWLWEAAYPQPWRSTVERAAAQQGLEPAYLYATMRQESGYDPDAVSPADAIGLLQLLPRSAARVSEGLGVPFRREMLFDPAWNIRLGAAEIASLLGRFDGCMPLSIAAYNAGAHRVDGWLERASAVELDHFVERIPFDETRNYVRRVMSHYARYRFLADPRGPWPVTLERCGRFRHPAARSG